MEPESAKWIQPRYNFQCDFNTIINYREIIKKDVVPYIAMRNSIPSWLLSSFFQLYFNLDLKSDAYQMVNTTQT